MSARVDNGLGHAATVLRLLQDLVRPRRLLVDRLAGLSARHHMSSWHKQVDTGWLMAGSMAIACGGQHRRRTHLQPRVPGAPGHRPRLMGDSLRESDVPRSSRALPVKCGLMAMAARKGRGLFTLDTLLLSTVFDAVYAGAFLPVPLWLETRGGHWATSRVVGIPGIAALCSSRCRSPWRRRSLLRGRCQSIFENSRPTGVLPWGWFARGGRSVALDPAQRRRVVDNWVRATAAPVAASASPTTARSERHSGGVVVACQRDVRCRSSSRCACGGVAPFLPAEPAPRGFSLHW